MEKLIETIKKMKDGNPETFTSLLEQMKHRASVGKLPGITVNMINEAYNHVIFEEDEMCIMPSSTLNLFLEAEEAIADFEDITVDESKYLNESELFNKMYSFEGDYISDIGCNLLEELLEVDYETI